MKGLIDMDDDEVVAPAGKKRHEPTAEERLKEDIYNRRVKLVRLSNTDYYKFKEYLLANEEFFKHHLSDYDKECLRHTCERAMERFDREASLDDYKIYDRIFGYSIDPRKSRTIPVYSDNSRRLNDSPYRLPIDQQVKWFYETTYEGFWKWISNPEIQDKLHYRNDLTESLIKTIENNKLRNYEIVRGRRKYVPTDEETFTKVVELTKEVRP